ncbi:MAG: hypothetical protein RJA10_4158, partial [Pseudomonadota bacterium]|jgi:hypothetical protein
VGLDLSPYYGHCQAIDLDAGLSHQVFQDVMSLFTRRSRR